MTLALDIRSDTEADLIVGDQRTPLTGPVAGIIITHYRRLAATGGSAEVYLLGLRDGLRHLIITEATRVLKDLRPPVRER